jgi:hypothetical protein
MFWWVIGAENSNHLLLGVAEFLVANSTKITSDFKDFTLKVYNFMRKV